jgi:hypothetical protein
MDRYYSGAALTRFPADLMAGAQRGGLLVGAIGLVVGIAGLLLGVSAEQFFRSYLIGFLFCLAIALGSMALAMIHQMTAGGWGMVARRPLEAASRTLPVVTLFFVPIAIFGMKALFVWARPDAVAVDPILQAKRPYLNVGFFVVRAAVYFALWNGFAFVMNRWSREQDEAGPQPIGTERKFRLLSAGGLVVYALTITFASVDWVMSLDAHWFSTIFGLLFISAQGLSALAFLIIVLAIVRDIPPMAGVIRPLFFHDIGKLMFTFVMLWAYMAFSQFLIIWAGNLPEEIPWYVVRVTGLWGAVALALVIVQFAAPFLLLLSRDLKRNARALRWVAIIVLFMRYVDLIWLVKPSSKLGLHWMDVALPAGLFGVWLFVFVAELRKRPALPVFDPYFQESMAVHAD